MKNLFYTYQKNAVSLGRQNRWFLFFCCLFFSTFSFAQTITIGSGVSSTTHRPINSSLDYSYTQAIYVDAEIEDTYDNKQITKIRYKLKTQPGLNSDQWTVWLGNTTKTSFTSNTDWILAGGLTQVFNGTVTFPANDNWMEITLTTPITYTGDNIVVAVREGSSGYGSAGSWYTYNSPIANTGLTFNNYTIYPDPSNPPIANWGRTQNLPQIQFEFVEATSCSGTPTAGTSSINPVQGVPGSTYVVSASGYSTDNGIEYQWQSNTNGAGWVDTGSSSSVYGNYTATSPSVGTVVE